MPEPLILLDMNYLYNEVCGFITLFDASVDQLSLPRLPTAP